MPKLTEARKKANKKWDENNKDANCNNKLNTFS